MQKLSQLIPQFVASLPIQPQQTVVVKQKTKSKLTGFVIFQSNQLITAKYSLTLQEKRIILWLMSKIQEGDKDFKEHVITVKELNKIIGLSEHTESTYSELKKVTYGLVQKGLRILDNDTGKEIQLTWVSCAEYTNGCVALSFSPKLTPLLLHLKRHFTATSLDILLQFKSIHAIRIYEILKRYETMGTKIVSIEEIRAYCGVEDKLEKYVDFDRFLLQIAQREINAKSDIHIEYKPIKTSRKYTAIKFIITKNKKYSLTLKDVEEVTEIRKTPEYNLVHELTDFGLTKKTAMTLVEQNTVEVIQNAISCVDIQTRRGHTRNPKALLIAAIKGKYDPNRYQKKLIQSESLL